MRKRRQVPQFFGARFDGTTDAFHFMAGTLSQASLRHIAPAMARLAREFEELARTDAHLPLELRDGCSAVFALRQSEFSGFTALRR